jgi:hypothetical protein
MSGYYDQSNVWHYNKSCMYDQYYTEGCENLDGEYDDDGIWQYDDPCSLDDDEDEEEEDEEECEEGDQECLDAPRAVNRDDQTPYPDVAAFKPLANSTYVVPAVKVAA